VDESGINKFLYREHGWAKRGKKVIGEVAGKRYMRESFIAGLVGNKVVAPLCYQGTCDTVLFKLLVRKLFAANPWSWIYHSYG